MLWITNKGCHASIAFAKVLLHSFLAPWSSFQSNCPQTLQHNYITSMNLYYYYKFLQVIYYSKIHENMHSFGAIHQIVHSKGAHVYLLPKWWHFIIICYIGNIHIEVTFVHFDLCIFMWSLNMLLFNQAWQENL
jgi:hypothetical protein